MAQKTLEYVGRSVSHKLNRVSGSLRFDVTLRLYHGWHKGFEPTPNRKALVAAGTSVDFAALSLFPNVLIRSEIAYGDRLTSALDTRLHVRLGIHLPDTLRRASKNQDFQEKMVDTAMSSDIVDLAHREPKRWLLIMANDDDLLPAAFTAEAIRQGAGGRVLLARARPGGTFFNLSGLQIG